MDSELPCLCGVDWRVLLGIRTVANALQAKGMGRPESFAKLGQATRSPKSLHVESTLTHLNMSSARPSGSEATRAAPEGSHKLGELRLAAPTVKVPAVVNTNQSASKQIVVVIASPKTPQRATVTVESARMRKSTD